MKFRKFGVVSFGLIVILEFYVIFNCKIDIVNKNKSVWVVSVYFCDVRMGGWLNGNIII